MYKKIQVNYYVVAFILFALPLMMFGTLPDIINNSVLSFPLKVLAQVEETSPTPGEQKVVRQGIATSSPDPLPGHEKHQSVSVLPLRNDNAVYSGRVTFTTTQPVEVQILHRNMNTTATGKETPIPSIPERFGKLNILQLPGGNGQVTITNVEPKITEGATNFAASVPFSGNAVALHNLDGKQFVTSYTVTADILGAATRADDIAKE
jgi:hypothetical protein